MKSILSAKDGSDLTVEEFMRLKSPTIAVVNADQQKITARERRLFLLQYPPLTIKKIGDVKKIEYELSSLHHVLQNV
ncbi:hypothetical protein [Mucilaginibacter sp. 44-25]|uniref:hypothetical protein n=1 Tax=Mucilaginibacter sp. 44-25 TaxID=1895794 RepID=UPI0025F29A5A|nr:hypothetical protein [Mucilaginibacter sp. 44-25]